MVGRHVEGPQILFDLEALALGRNDETGDAARAPVLARGARENEIVSGHVQAGVPHFGTVDAPPIAVASRARFHPGRIRAVIRLGQPESDANRAIQDSWNELLLLLLGAEVAKHQHRREVAY